METIGNGGFHGVRKVAGMPILRGIDILDGTVYQV